MISVAFEPGFITREFLEMSLSRPCTVFLQALTQGMVSLAVLFDCLTAKCFAFAIGSQIDNAQINPKGSIRSVRWWFWGVNGYSQVEGAIAVDQISLPFYGIHTCLLIPTDQKWDKYTTRNRQERDRHQAFKAHDSLIIGDSTLWPEMRLDALIALVGFTGLTDTANSQLSSQLVGGAQFSIDQLLQCKLVSALFSKSHACHVVGCFVKSVHRVKQGVVLFFSWCQFQEHCLFHRNIVLSIEKNVIGQGATPPKPQIRNASFLPGLKTRGFQRRRYCERCLQRQLPY